VIASRRGALVEIVQHERTGLVFDPDRPAELVGILRRLDKAALAGMGENAREEFLRSFVADRMNAELLALYRAVASARNLAEGARRAGRVLQPRMDQYRDGAVS
jgi:glycosyltransferase involved in cell wall biosynthesis